MNRREAIRQCRKIEKNIKDAEIEGNMCSSMYELKITVDKVIYDLFVRGYKTDYSNFIDSFEKYMQTIDPKFPKYTLPRYSDGFITIRINIDHRFFEEEQKKTEQNKTEQKENCQTKNICNIL